MPFALDSDTFSLLTNEHPTVVQNYTEAEAAGEIVFLPAATAEEAIQGALNSITMR